MTEITLAPPSSDEVVMELVRGIRNRELKTVAQVRALSQELFPTFTAAEHEAGVKALANRLCANMTPLEKRAIRQNRLNVPVL
jgi:hypothetical protein